MPTPSTREALDRVLEAGRQNLHTCFPARVIAYDAVSQTVDVQPQLMRELSDDEGALTYEELPTLYDVPVQWPRAGGFALTFPIQAGDYVAILCAEQSTLAWRQSGAISEPGLSQPHGLNGCIALCGWYPDGQRLTSVSTSALTLRNDTGTTQIVIDESNVHLGGTGGAALAYADGTKQAINAIVDKLAAAPAPIGPVGSAIKTQLTAIFAQLATTKTRAL